MKSVTVVISTYKGAEHIERQLDSIFAQENVDVNVLIRDDASPDNTLEVIGRYSKAHPEYKIKVLKGKNMGFAKSFWLALCQCPDTDYYAFSDQDDVWKPDKLIKCIDAMTDDDSVPQLSYCRMQRSNIDLEPLDEQIDIMPPEQLTKKLTLIKTFNYGAATVINRSAKELVCRCWPTAADLPHDMWIGTLCHWFGKVYYVDEPLYFWIRYETSVTGEGTKKTGIRYRLKKCLEKQSYPNLSYAMLKRYSDLLLPEDEEFLRKIANYKHSLRDKLFLLHDPDFTRPSLGGTLALKLGILLNWY